MSCHHKSSLWPFNRFQLSLSCILVKINFYIILTMYMKICLVLDVQWPIFKEFMVIFLQNFHFDFGINEWRKVNVGFDKFPSYFGKGPNTNKLRATQKKKSLKRKKKKDFQINEPSHVRFVKFGIPTRRFQSPSFN